MDVYWEDSINNTVSFFFLAAQKRSWAKLCLWICDQNAEVIPTELPIEIDRN